MDCPSCSAPLLPVREFVGRATDVPRDTGQLFDLPLQVFDYLLGLGVVRQSLFLESERLSLPLSQCHDLRGDPALRCP